MTTNTDRLLTEFPEHTYDDWHAAAEALLKGAPFEKLLVSKTHEDITIQPIYRREDIANLEHNKHYPGADTMVRGSHAKGVLDTGWEVSQELRASTPEDLNQLIHEGINGGQSELNIAVGCGQPTCCTGGARINTKDAMKIALDGVSLESVSTYFQCGPSSTPVASIFFAAARELGTELSSLRGGVQNDPLGELIQCGTLREPLATRLDHMASLTSYAIAHAPEFRTITIRGDIYHNSGASSTQELAYVIGTLVAYIGKMQCRGISPEQVMPHIRIQLAVGSDYFMEIAKIRATRWLWSKVAAAYGVENAPIHIHATTSKWNKTTYDAHTNMLRVTSEAFAAVVAGVDSLHIGPYDEIAGTSTEISRRIARNLHTILREECGLDQVIDPAGGSTYIEWLTDQVAAKSWELFQNIEKAGGMIDCIEKGSIQQAVDTVCKAKFKNIRIRKEKIVGANMYPDLKGKKLEVTRRDCTAGQPVPDSPAPEKLDIPSSIDASMIEQTIAAATDGATKQSIAISISSSKEDEIPGVTPLEPHRAAEEYEALRDASAAYLSKTGAPPTILQLNMGPSGKYRLRADWTASFFEAAGFKIDGERDFITAEDAVAAVSDGSASIAVITSDDGTYQELAADLAKAVKSAKPDITLLLAGAPGDSEAAWREAGIDLFVHVRCNNYELNEQLLKVAGVL